MDDHVHIHLYHLLLLKFPFAKLIGAEFHDNAGI